MLASAMRRYLVMHPNLRRLVTRAVEGDADLTVELCGTELPINTVEEHGYLRASRMASTSSFLGDELAVVINLASVIAAGDTFVDVGANVGFYSRTVARFSRVLGPIPVYAFEPNPGTFERLVRHMPEEVTAEQIAISDHEGVLEFLPGAVSHAFEAIQGSPGHAKRRRTMKVPCRRLDQCNIRGNSLVVKVDVEGHERQVLAGARGLFEAERVKVVYIDGYSDPSVRPFLSSFGFRLLDGRTLLPVERDVWSLLALSERGVAGSP